MTMVMSKVLFERVGEVIVSYCTDGVLDDADGKRLKDACVSSNVRKFISISDGNTTTTSTQRSESIEALKGMDVIVLVTDSIIVRGVATMLNWFDVKVKSYSNAETRQAISALDISQNEQERVAAVVQNMRTLVRRMEPVAAHR